MSGPKRGTIMKLFGFIASLFVGASPAAETKLVDPRGILFSTPTLNDALPAFQEDGRPGGKLLQLHEDDWRQFEAISIAKEAEIARELTAIRVVLETASVKTKAGDHELTAFKQVHIRKLITEPFKDGPRRSQIASLAESPATYAGLSLSGSPPVRGGYAFSIDGLTVYGQSDGEHLLSLCFTSDGSSRVGRERALKLVELLHDAGLVVVHWPSATKLVPETDFLAYLTGDSAQARADVPTKEPADPANAALALVRQHKFGEAKQLLLKAAEKDDFAAQALLGQMYNAGWGMPADYQEAFKWWSRAATGGSTDALWGLGLLYDDGKGVARDSKKAAQFWRQGAERGNIKATVNLAFLYEDGRGVERDLKECARLFKIAAEAGEPGPQFNYALKLLSGEGVERDEILGAAWLGVAAESPRIKGTGYEERLVIQRDKTWSSLSAIDRDKAAQLMSQIQARIPVP